MLNREQVEMLFEAVKKDIREEAKRGSFNLYSIGYYNAVVRILCGWADLRGQEDGVAFWERMKREESKNASQDSESRSSPVCREGGEGRSAE